MTEEIINFQRACEEVSRAKDIMYEKRKILLHKFANIMRLYYPHRRGYTGGSWNWSNFIANHYSDYADALEIDNEFGMVEYSHNCLSDSRSDPSDIVIRIPIKLFGLSDEELIARAAERKAERERLFEAHGKRAEDERKKDRERREYKRYLELKEKYEKR